MGLRNSQIPFENLGFLPTYASHLGSDEVSDSFAKCVRKSNDREDFELNMKPSQYRQGIEWFDVEPSQNFWEAMNVTDGLRNEEDVTIISGRKVLVNLLSFYEEVIEHIRVAIKELIIKLRHDEGAGAGARIREFLYSVVHQGTEDRKWAVSTFNYDRRCSKPNLALHSYYQGNGILAIMPLRRCDDELSQSPSRLTSLIQILDSVPQIISTLYWDFIRRSLLASSITVLSSQRH